jgi:hypothetical protein
VVGCPPAVFGGPAETGRSGGSGTNGFVSVLLFHLRTNTLRSHSKKAGSVEK